MKNEEIQTSTMEILFSLEGISIVRYEGKLYNRIEHQFIEFPFYYWQNTWLTDLRVNSPELNLIVELETEYQKVKQ